MTKEFPDWAPEPLVSAYIKRDSGKAQSGPSIGLKFYDNDILYKILTDPKMEKVWKSLIKKSNKPEDIYSFYITVQKASWGPTHWDKKTLTEKKDWVTKVTTKCAELKKLFENSPYFYTAYDFLGYWDKHIILVWLNRATDIDFVIEKGHLEIVHPDICELYEDAIIDAWNESKGVYEESELFKELDFEVEKILWDFFESPNIKEYLDEMSRKINLLLSEDSILKRPNIENREKVYFIRTLGDYLQKRYGTPLYEAIVKTACVILDDSTIDKEIVISALKPRRKKQLGGNN